MATGKKTSTTMKLTANAIETVHLRRFLRQHPFLAQLLPSNGVVFQCDGDAPSPSKDYGQLEINLDKVTPSLFAAPSHFSSARLTLVEDHHSQRRRFSLPRRDQRHLRRLLPR